MSINRDRCIHFYSLINLAVQDKAQSSELQGRGFLLPLFSLGHVFLLFCYDVCDHV